MKKILFTALCVFFLGASQAHALQDWQAMQGPAMTLWGQTGDSAATTFVLDSNLSFGVSGDAYALRWLAHESQTSGDFTAYFYCTAKTGSPTATVLDIYSSYVGTGDAQRPISLLYSSANVDASGCSTPQWLTYTISGVTFVKGTLYYAVLHNETASPGSNYPTFQTRQGTGANSNQTYLHLWFGVTTTDGFATDPTASLAYPPSVVIKYDSGYIVGSPYVRRTAHANNTNDRGTRYIFDTDATVYAIFSNVSNFAATTTANIYQGSTLIASQQFTPERAVNAMATLIDPVTLSANTDYDVVFDPAANFVTTMPKFDAGANVPADVQAVLMPWSVVDGATPGSYTVTATSTSPIGLLIQSYPASAGGTTINGPSFFGNF